MVAQKKLLGFGPGREKGSKGKGEEVARSNICPRGSIHHLVDQCRDDEKGK